MQADPTYMEYSDASITFQISGDDVYVYLYLSKNPPNVVKLAQLLKGINAAEYIGDTVNIMKSYSEQNPESADYLAEVKNLWAALLRETIQSNPDAIREATKDPNDELVVSPTEFITYQGFAGQ